MNKDQNSEPYDLSKAQYFEAVAEMRQQSLRRAWAKIRKYREELNQISAENKRLRTKIETIRCLLGSSVPSDADLDTAIDAALSSGSGS